MVSRLLLTNMCKKLNTLLNSLWVMFSDDFHSFTLHHPWVKHLSKGRNDCQDQADKVLLSWSLPSVSRVKGGRRRAKTKSVEQQTVRNLLSGALKFNGWQQRHPEGREGLSERVRHLIWNLSDRCQPSVDLGESVLVTKPNHTSKCQGPKAWRRLA